MDLCRRRSGDKTYVAATMPSRRADRIRLLLRRSGADRPRRPRAGRPTSPDRAPSRRIRNTTSTLRRQEEQVGGTHRRRRWRNAMRRRTRGTRSIARGPSWRRCGWRKRGGMRVPEERRKMKRRFRGRRVSGSRRADRTATGRSMAGRGRMTRGSWARSCCRCSTR